MKTMLPSSNELRSFKAFFFDFDGVILESANIKTEAFGEMYRPVGLENEVLKYHLQNQGVSRYEKFRWIAENLENRAIDEVEVEEKALQFNDLVFSKVLSASFVPGVKRLLDKLKEWGTPCLVASGTPQDELQRIVMERGLNHYFRGVFGSPDKKIAIINRECSEYGWNPEDCLFLGDASTDYEAAKATGCKFFARYTPEMKELWETAVVDFGSTDFQGLQL